MTRTQGTAAGSGPGSAVEFSAELLATGKTSTGIAVPDGVIERLGAGKRPPVQATLGDHTYRTTLGVMGGKTMLPVSAEHRQKAGITAGDHVAVRLQVDAAPREVDIPADFAAALDAVPVARRFFDSLSPSQRRWHVLSVEGAKTPETRSKRIGKSVALLRERRAR